MLGGSREARWKTGRGAKKKPNCRLVRFVVERRCKFREFDGVRGRYSPGLEFDSEGLSCDVGL
jgi:hypothetical protein